MATTPTGEATPSNNTDAAVKLNPITFDEIALAQALELSLAEPEIEDKKPVEPEPKAADAEPEAEAAQEEAEQVPSESEESDSSSEENDLSQSEEQQAEPDGVQKRINKLVAAKKTAEEALLEVQKELASIRAKLEEKASRPEESPIRNEQDSPFSDIWDQSKLTQEYEKARALRRFCEDNPEGAEINGKEYTAQDIKSIRRKVEDAIELHIPKRNAFLQQYQQVKPLAEKIYPFWADRTTREYAEAQATLRMMPALASIPAYQVLIGDYLAGKAARLAKEQAAAKPTTPKPVVVKAAPRQPGITKTAPARVDAKTEAREASLKQFLRHGSEEYLAQLLEN